MLGNKPESEIERRVRSELHRRGLRFRKHLAPLAGVRCRPDIVFSRQRLAIFIDGCFWHQCPEHGSLPRANRQWWKDKLEANVARDQRNNASFAAAGWTVMRFWTHEEIDSIVDAVVLRLGSPLGTN